MEIIVFTNNLVFNYFMTIGVHYTFLMFFPVAIISILRSYK